MQSLSVAVILLNFNSKKYLEKFLPKLVQNSANATIYIIDNASTDDSLEFVKIHFPIIEIINLKKNYGFAGGYYHGLKYIKEEIFVLLNTDVEVTPNWLDPIRTLMQQDDTIGACQPKILSYNKKDCFEYAGASGGFIDGLGFPFTRGRIFDTIEKDNGQYDTVLPCFWASGCALFIRKKAYFEAKELDQRLFAHQEEIDLCWRLQKIGFKVMVVPNSVVYHVGGGTLNYNNPRKTYLNFRNNLFICIKNWHTIELIHKLPTRIFLNFVASLKEMSSGNFSQAIAILKATFIGQVYFFHYRFGKHRVKQTNKIDTIYSKSILKQYFYKKHKHFNQLE